MERGKGGRKKCIRTNQLQGMKNDQARYEGHILAVNRAVSYIIESINAER